jgi:neutral ceramidase
MIDLIADKQERLMGQWRVGFSKRQISPPLGTPLAGYGQMPARTAANILDDLFARAIVLDDGTRRIAVVSLDITAVSSPLSQSIRTRAAQQSGIPADAILISATHSHSTPAGCFLRHWGAISPDYLRAVEKAASDAIVEAAQHRFECSIGFGEAQSPGIATNRIRPEGPVDHTLRVLSIQPKDKAHSSILLTHFACHPVHLPPHTRDVTADFPGALIRKLEHDRPGTQALFLQGCLGDINPAGTHSGTEAAEKNGRQLATATEQAGADIVHAATGELAYARMTCELPLNLDDARTEALAFLFETKVRRLHENLAATGFLREWAHETLGLLAAHPPQTLRCEISAFKIGDAVIVGLPGEMYTCVGAAIRAASPYKNTWIAGFSDGCVGYVTHEDDFQEDLKSVAAGGGPYAAIMAPKIYGYPPFRPDAWRVIVDSAVRLLKSL